MHVRECFATPTCATVRHSLMHWRRFNVHLCHGSDFSRGISCSNPSTLWLVPFFWLQFRNQRQSSLLPHPRYGSRTKRWNKANWYIQRELSEGFRFKANKLAWYHVKTTISKLNHKMQQQYHCCEVLTQLWLDVRTQNINKLVKLGERKFCKCIWTVSLKSCRWVRNFVVAKIYSQDTITKLARLELHLVPKKKITPEPQVNSCWTTGADFHQRTSTSKVCLGRQERIVTHKQ